MKIIEASQEHLNSFMEMAMDLWKEDYDSNELKNIFTDMLSSEKSKVLLCLVDDVIAAFIFLSVRTDYVEGSTSSPTGYVEGIYVKKDFRNMGVAKRLLLQGEMWLKEKGCKQIGSDSYIDNKLSYNFHLGAGFREAGKLITFIKDIE